MIDPASLKIAIASGKGGTGKTFLATNLAAFLSKTRKTLLVDLDVEEPNDLIFFDREAESIIPQYKMIPVWNENNCTLCGICSQVCRYHAVVRLGTFIAVFNELCHSCYACSELCPSDALPMQEHKMGQTTMVRAGSLLIVESRLEVGEEQAVPLIRLTHLAADQNYHDVAVQIFDCPPGTSCPMVNAVKECDFAVLVAEPTPFGLNDLKLAVETLKLLEKPFGVVINRDGTGNEEVSQFCLEAQIAVIGRIPFDRKFAAQYSTGRLCYDQDSRITDALQQIMQSIGQSIGKYE